MKRLVLAALLLAPLSAWAQEPPKTIELPTDTVDSIGRYLATRPYNEVAAMMAMIQNCVAIQMPKPAPGAQCPAVAQAISARLAPPPTPLAAPPKQGDSQ